MSYSIKPKFCIKCGKRTRTFYQDDLTGFVLCPDCYFGEDCEDEDFDIEDFLDEDME